VHNTLKPLKKKLTYFLPSARRKISLPTIDLTNKHITVNKMTKEYKSQKAGELLFLFLQENYLEVQSEYAFHFFTGFLPELVLTTIIATVLTIAAIDLGRGVPKKLITFML
jgi:hypothetical protein